MTQTTDAIFWLEGIEKPIKTTIQEIKDKLNHVKHPKVLARMMSNRFGVNAYLIHEIWLNNFFLVPVNKQSEVLEYLNNYLKYE